MAFEPRGIHNVGEFYSTHYLEELLKEDLKSVLLQYGGEDAQKALRALRKQFEALRRAEPEQRAELTFVFHRELLANLGYPQQGQELTVQVEPDVLARVMLDLSVEGKRRLVALEAPYLEQGQSLLEARPRPPIHVDHLSGERSFQDDVEELIHALFTLDEPPRWVLALGGREALLAERSRWGQGRYLRFDLETVMSAEPTELTMTAALLCRAAVAPEEGTPVHDLLDEGSHRHAYSVSEDLKYNLREAVELLGNAWVRHQREAKLKVFEGEAAGLFDDRLARELTSECLTFLYRLLFIFYAEAHGDELGILPMRSESYRNGYSLEHLRDLELVPLHSQEARRGTFLHESLEKLFKLLHAGLHYDQTDALRDEALTFEVPALDSSLFDPARTPRLSAARLPNEVMQQVLQLLSLSREESGRGWKRGRGRMSYALLGINQLGAVYEGLLSYTGFFAREDLFELKRAGKKEEDDALDQVFFARASEVDRFKDEEFVVVSDPDDPKHPTQRKRYPKGSFVYRLAGRDRVRSASYYTPEVLTRCVVKYALKELLPGKTADELLQVTLCEPAMGSGAFLNEGINQLAGAYLTKKQDELQKRIPQADYALERQRVKAYLATHNAYGVDLNPVAGELARVSLWLNILGPGIPVPWFDLRLGVGNSLVGCRRQLFRARDVLRKQAKTASNFLGLEPESVPLGKALPEDGIFHFLLPDEGMAAVADDKVARSLSKEAVATLREWKKRFISAAWTKEEVAQLRELTRAADRLWAQHAKDRRRALDRTAQRIGVWGQPASESGSLVRRAEREAIVREELGQRTAGARLQLAMDAWCSLWAWPLEAVRALPERAQWLGGLEALLLPEEPVDPEQVKAAHPWLASARGGFFHWELAFAEVFAERGGFDLTLGNPPWVKLEWREAGILSEFEATLGVRDVSASDLASMRPQLLNTKQRAHDYLSEMTQTLGLKSYLGATQAYPLLAGVQSNLYKNFLSLGWRLGAPKGVAGFIHQEGLFDDPRGGKLRAAAYARLRYRFEFMNKLLLFQEIEDQKHYGLLVSGAPQQTISFQMVTNCLHPRVIDGSFAHPGTGPTPGIKDKNGDWDVRGHRSRILCVDEHSLGLFARLYDSPATLAREARLPVVHGSEMLQVLERLSKAPKLMELGDRWSSTVMWDETNRQQDGTIAAQERECRKPEDWIVSGPHFYVARPFNKTPNPGCKHNQDYGTVDLTKIPDDYLPRTNYSPGCPPKEYRARTPTFKSRLVTEFYRHVHREMVAVTGERTLIPAIIPPGAGHINTVFAVIFEDEVDLLTFSGLASSLLVDFFIRSTGKGHVNDSLSAAIPFPRASQWAPQMIGRVLRLNCLTTHYADLWERNVAAAASVDSLSRQDSRLEAWHLPAKWERTCALRTDFERRQALLEIDVLAALALDVSVDALVQIYQVQFPVLQGYDRAERYDQTGRLVSTHALNHVRKMSQSDGTVTDPKDPSITYILPFDGCDREADMRQAYAEFQRRRTLADPEAA